MRWHQKLSEDEVTYFDDPVAVAAPIARQLAREHCRTDLTTGETCAWYHGARLYIRALGIGQCNVPDSHREFFETAFHELARRGGSRSILVSGSADYAMPALILNAFAPATPPNLTVVDICATPLLLIEWYGRRHGLEIATTQSDILDYAPTQASDVLCTHHLFNYFTPDARPAVVARWRDMLRPGGTLVVVNRFRTPGSASSGSHDSRRSRFTEAEVLAAQQRAQSLGLQSDEFEAMIRNYRSRIRAHCLESESELQTLLDNGGFAIETYVNLTQKRTVVESPSNEETAQAVGVVARRV